MTGFGSRLRGSTSPPHHHQPPPAPPPPSTPATRRQSVPSSSGSASSSLSPNPCRRLFSSSHNLTTTTCCWAHDPLPRLPESLLDIVASYLPQRDVLRCRLVAKHHHAAFPKTLRRLQLSFHHAGRVDWPAFGTLESLHIGLGGKGLVGTDEKHSPLAALFPPPPPALMGASSLALPSLFPHLRELSLIGLMLGDARMASLWAGLGRLERLEHLNLDGNGLTDLSLVALAQEVVGERQQQQRALSSSSSSSSLFPDFAVSSSSTSTTVITTPFPRLTKLQLSSNQLGDAGVAWLLRALAEAKVSLRILDLSDNCLGEITSNIEEEEGPEEEEEEEEEGGREGGLREVCRALVETEAGGRLEELWLSYNQLTDESLRGLSRKVIAKGRLPCLQRIELESNQIGNEGVESLAAALLACSSLPTSSSSSASQLTTINLCKNTVGDSGAQALALSLVHSSCRSLSRLDLSGNQIATSGAVALAVALASGGTALRVLSLAWNDLRDAGVVAFAEELTAGRRTRKGGRTGAREEEKLEEGEEEEGKMDDEEEEDEEEEEEEEEVGRPWLERLELSNNSIGDKGVQALAAALQTAPPLARLESIDLTGNDFHELGIGSLAAIAAGGRFQQQQQQQQSQQQWRWLEKKKGSRKGGREGGREQQQQQVFPDVRVYDGLLLGDLLGWQTSSTWPVTRGEDGREGGVEGGATNGGKAGGGAGKGGGDARQLLFRRRQSQRMERREQQAQEQQQQGLGKGVWGVAWDVVLYVLARTFGGRGEMRE